MSIESTLKDRGSVYGSYQVGTEFRAKVMDLIDTTRCKHGFKPLTTVEKVYIFDIINKLSRLVATPNHIDTWHDIAGYATLVEKVYLSDLAAGDINVTQN